MDLTEKVNVPELQKVVAIIVAGVPLADIVKRTVPSSTDVLGKRMADRVERCFVKTAKMIEDAGVAPQPVEDKLVIEILRGASLEENEDLHTMWAALLANSATESSDAVRPSFAAILRQMAPDEAKVMNWIFDLSEGTRKKIMWQDTVDALAFEPGLLAICLEGLEASQLIRNRRSQIDELRALRVIDEGISVPPISSYEITARG